MFCFGSENSLLRNFISSLLAFPFSGGALMRIFIVWPSSSSIISDMQFFSAFGITFILKYLSLFILLFRCGF